MAVTGQVESLAVRLVGLVRSVALGGLAGAIAGVVVLGVGGRFVMFVSRLLHPEALGRITESGARIGEFTVEGTIGLVIFGGLLSGLLAGVIWVLVREWIPRKAALVGLGAVAIGGSFLIHAGNRDFFILQDPRLDLVQISGWLKHTYPDTEAMHVSHETIYLTLFIQTRGGMKHQLTNYLRTP